MTIPKSEVWYPARMDRDRIIKIAREEMSKHTMTFVENPPSIAQGGQGVVVSGCPACRKRFQSLNQLAQHLLDDAAGDRGQGYRSG